MDEYLKFRIASWLSRNLSRNFAYWIGLRVADRYFKNDHSGRNAVISNLKAIYNYQDINLSDEKLTGLARKTYQYFGKYIVDFFRFSRLSQHDISKLVSIEHGHYLEEAKNSNRGTILLTAHMGSWELGASVLTSLGYELSAVTLPERLDKLNILFRKQRKDRGMHIISLGNAGRTVIKRLKNGGIVALLGDRDFTARNDRVHLFGKSARLPRGPAWLSKKTGAIILPTFLLRMVDDSFLLRLYPPIDPLKIDSQQAVQEKIRIILEKVISEYPYQWFIFDDFWADSDKNLLKQRLKKYE